TRVTVSAELAGAARAADGAGTAGAGTAGAGTAGAATPTGIVVSVLDDGASMPSEVASAPFEPVRRRRTPTAGAGLGLSIAKGIVDAHGGHIVLEQPAKGTRFLVHLPVEMPHVSVARPAELGRGVRE